MARSVSNKLNKHTGRAEKLPVPTPSTKSSDLMISHGNSHPFGEKCEVCQDIIAQNPYTQQLIKDTREKALAECISKVTKYRDGMLSDEEKGKDWYEKNYWVNRVIGLLEDTNE